MVRCKLGKGPFGRSVSLDRDERVQHRFYNELCVALYIINVAIF